jgi:hypothetical protein
MNILPKNVAVPTSSLRAQLNFNGVTAIAAATAAVASAASLMAGLPVWAMFIGWVAFFSRGHSFREGIANYCGVLAGICFGMGAAMAISALGPMLGKLALPIVVFIVAMMVVSLRAMPIVNNVLAYFLGLIAYFAAHVEPSFEALGRLGEASAIGSFAAWTSLKLQQRLMA